MKKEIYNKNVDYLFNILNSTALIKFNKLKSNIDEFVRIFCNTENEIKEYYLNQFEVVKKEILNNQNKYNYKYLFEMDFINDTLILDKSKFELKAELFLKIPYKELIENILFEQNPTQIEDINKVSLEVMSNDFKKQIERINSVYNILKVYNAEDILTLSIRLFYFKHLSSEHKQNESDNLKVTNLPKFDLYQRYLILKETTDIATDIKNLNTSTVTSKHKLLAILLNCNIDNAKHLLGNHYMKKLKWSDEKELDKTDEVNEFIQSLKIKD